MIRFFLSLLLFGSFMNVRAAEILELDVISYEKFVEGDREALEILDKALHEKGIVGIKGIPGYKEQYEEFIQAYRAFNALPGEVKEKYKPNRGPGDTFLGYEEGKEKFQRPDGKWVVDDLKTSYYAFVKDFGKNKWPEELDLKTPYEALGNTMAKMGEAILYQIGLLGEQTGMHLETESYLGRMLYYRKSESNENPYWGGAHFDHDLLTALLPSVYFVDGEQIPEPEEAGLFIRTAENEPYKKIVADDLDVMMFQVGEFGQLVRNDEIRATEHRVHKAEGPIERYTLALFFNAPMDVPIHSTSILANDPRYGAEAGEACTFRQWHTATFERFLVKDEE